MASTPPPPPQTTPRVPATPRHGANFDSYGRIPSRRSERLAGQSLTHGRYSSPGLGSPGLRVGTGSPVAGSPHQHSQREGDGTLSTAASSSGDSPQRKHSGITCPADVERSHHSLSHHAKEEHIPPTSTSTSALTTQHLSHNLTDKQTKMTAGMLPTPVKTPRKKTVPKADLDPRSLFSSRSHTLPSEELAPKKSKGKKSSHFSLESFNSDREPHDPPQIEVFTDSRDRIPTVNHSMDNPFSRKSTETEASMDGAGDPSKKRRKVESAETKRDSNVDETIHRDDGLLYVFRGKKVFRKFNPESEDEDDPSELGLLSSRPDLVDGLTPSHVRPLSRSSVKPRVLFPTAAQSASRELKDGTSGKGVDNNAQNDQDSDAQVETPNPTTATDIIDEEPLRIPTSKPIDTATPTTPLASGRSLRSHMRKETERQVTPCEPTGAVPKRFSPFDRWWRTKGQSTPTQTKKRTASSAEGGNEREVKKLRGE